MGGPDAAGVGGLDARRAFHRPDHRHVRRVAGPETVGPEPEPGHQPDEDDGAGHPPDTAGDQCGVASDRNELVVVAI